MPCDRLLQRPARGRILWFMAIFSSSEGDPVRLMVEEWHSGSRRFVCTLCSVRRSLLERVAQALGQEEGARLEHMWLLAQQSPQPLPSEEEIYEVHRLCKEWRRGHRNFVVHICTGKPELFGLLMDFVGTQYSQDLLHHWLVEHLRLSTPPDAAMVSPDMAAAGGSGEAPTQSLN